MNKISVRADKLLSSLGLTSRRNVQTYLANNSITADGVRIIEHGQRVHPKSEIKINGKELKKPQKVYFLINKPKGIVSTSNDEYGRKNVVSLIKTDARVYPVGRLDRDTHGLLILTNDGELTNTLIHPKYHIGKTYQLIIKGPVNASQLERMEEGVELEDGITQKAKVSIVQRRKDATVLEMTIYEGKKRQIRRMCDAVNLNLVDLSRIRFGPIDLGTLKEGEYRVLSGREVEKLKILTRK